jgi:hypothetical protein
VALLHDVIDDTDCKLIEVRAEFGEEIAGLVDALTVCRDWGGSIDPMVLKLKLADRLHNLQTIRHLPRARQRLRSRETLDVFVPAAERLQLTKMGGLLRRLALENLATEPQTAPDDRLAILGIDIEASTGRTDPVKGRLRQAMYGLLERALREGGVHEEYRKPYMDRGDGVLVLVDPTLATKLVDTVIPELAGLLAWHNATEPASRFRLRTVVHAGRIHHDRQGCFGEALDLACRLLDASRTKEMLRLTTSPLVLVTSDDTYQTLQHGIAASRVTVTLGARQHHGWLWNTARSWG